MRISLFYHSLLSDWNHGNAHFLRGLVSALKRKGHTIQVFEPRNGWSYSNWMEETDGQGPEDFRRRYPGIFSQFYQPSTDFDEILSNSDLTLVHEWTDPDLIRYLGERNRKHDSILLFHDTHHRSATAPAELDQLDLSGYDGVLAFGEVVKDLYLRNGWAERVYVWHEAADTPRFRPLPGPEKQGDLVWIGNWGDNERTEGLKEFLIEPSRELGLKTKMYGVRYPKKALELLEENKIEYGGYLPSSRVPEVFSQYHCTVHIPRKAYTEALPGIPTIRPFEALACGIPLISAPWDDTEQLFRKGKDFLMVHNGREMKQALRQVLQEPQKADALSRNGVETIQNRHTCMHRAEELLRIASEIRLDPSVTETQPYVNKHL